MKTPPIAILRLGETFPDVAERLGGFADWVAAGLGDAAVPVQVVDIPGGAAFPDPARIAGVILTGAHDMLTEQPPWNAGAARWLYRAVVSGCPALGICYGHQLLAHAFGGTVGDNPNGREFGTARVQRLPAASADPLMKALPERFRAHVCHKQSVLEMPREAVLLARNAHDPHHAFRIGPSAWGVQFHPEFSEAAIRTYVAASAEDLRREGQAPERLLADVCPTPDAAGLLPRFADLAAALAQCRR